MPAQRLHRYCCGLALCALISCRAYDEGILSGPPGQVPPSPTGGDPGLGGAGSGGSPAGGFGGSVGMAGAMAGNPGAGGLPPTGLAGFGGGAAGSIGIPPQAGFGGVGFGGQAAGGLSGSAAGLIGPGMAGMMTQTFADNFSDGFADGWSSFAGDWSVNGGAYTCDAGQGRKAIVDGLRFKDFAFEVRTRLASGQSGQPPSGDFGIVYRATNLSSSNNGMRGYYFSLRTVPPGVLLGRMEQGWTKLGEAPLQVNFNAWHRLRAVVKGARHEFYVDDSLVLTSDDAVITGGGSVG
ncbi:MAG: DUF1080 domain-containing protein, partial [Proteobacteria bacterium]|nr:DUF1080 domain-containing protein [Pseudomonadota bacterium]